MSTRIESPRRQAGARRRRCVDVAKLVAAYYERVPDPAVAGAARRLRHLRASRLVVRRARSTRRTCSRSAQAICEYRAQRRASTARCSSASTPTRCRSRRSTSALEVLAANGVEVMLAAGDEYTPTPAISHAILVYNRGRTERPRRRHRRHALAQPARQTAASSTTRRTAARPTPTSPAGSRRRPTRLLEQTLAGVRAHADARRRCARRRRTATTTSDAYVADLGNVIDLDAIRERRRAAWASIRSAAPACTTGRASPSATGSTSTVVSEEVDPTFRFMTARLGRPDPHGPVVAVRDAAADRHEGPLRRRLRLRHRPRPARHRHAERRPAAAEPLPGGRRSTTCSATGRSGRRSAAVGKTVVSTSHDRPRRRAAGPQALRSAGRLQVVRRRPARRLARLRRRRERRRLVPAPRRQRLDDRQGRHRAGAARRPRSPRAPAAIRARATTSSPASSASRSPIASTRRPPPSRRQRSPRSRRSSSARRELAGEPIERVLDEGARQRRADRRHQGDRRKTAGSRRGPRAPRTSTRSTPRASPAPSTCSGS